MHLRPAERLVVGLLAGGHLHQRRAAEEDLGRLLDHHGVVAHPRDVGAAGRRVAEDQRDRRLLAGAGPGQVAEDLAAGDEDLLLRGQVRAARLDQRDRRQAVLLRDLRGPEPLLHRPRVARPALDRGVVGGDQALDALDHTDAGHQRGADGEVRAPRRERRELQEGAARVDQQLDPLAREQLAAGVVPLDVLLPAPGHRLRVLGVELGDLGQHRRTPAPVGRTTHVGRATFAGRATIVGRACRTHHVARATFVGRACRDHVPRATFVGRACRDHVARAHVAPAHRV